MFSAVYETTGDTAMTSDTFRRMMEKMEDRFRELEDTVRTFEQDFDSEFGDSLRSRFGSFPVDIEETDDEITVKADLPGIEKDQIDVNVTENMVTIQAQDEREVREEGKNYVRQERRAQNYNRNLRLPASVDMDSAEAAYDDGVLTVTVEKQSASKGTSIDIE
jgi:HSP20 family protein